MQEQEIPTINEDVEQTIPVEYDNEPIQGINATIQIGDVTTGEAGTDASVENVGTPTHAVLNFTIPRGLKGETGDSATIKIAVEAQQLPSGSAPTTSIVNLGDTHNADYKLTIGIPKGETGDSATIQMSATATTLAAGSQATATITNSGDSHNANYVLALGIPRGADGRDGADGQSATIKVGTVTVTTLTEGSSATATVTNVGTSRDGEFNFTFGIPEGKKGETGQRGSVKSQYVAELPASGDEDTFYLVDRDLESHTESGEYITLETTQTAAAIQSAQLNGNATQTTYSGKNLFGIEDASAITQNGITVSVSNDTININGTATTSFGVVITSLKKDIVFENGTSYTFSKETTGSVDGSWALQFRDANDATILETNPYFYPTTVSNASGTAKAIRLYIASGRKFTNYTIKIQLEKGSSATSYEPYVGGTPAPNPDSPQPISVVTGENVVKVVGKNLLAPFDWTRLSAGITFTASNGGITISGTATSNAFMCGNAEMVNNFPHAILPAGTYTLSAKDGMAGAQFRIVDVSSYTVLAYCEAQSTTFTLTEQHEVSINARVSSGTVIATPVTIYPQLELGSQASDYQPYQGQEFPIDLGSIELAKIPGSDYKDKILYDKTTGKWRIEKQVGKVVLDGTEAWPYYSSYGGFRYRNNDFNVSSNNPSEDLICSHFTVATVRGTSPTAPVIKTYALNTDSTYIFLCDGTSDVDAFKSWLSTHPTTVYYALATPTTTEITDQTLIDQLEALASATLNQGVNNIWIEIATGNAMPTLELNWVEWEKHNRHNVYIWNDDIDDWQVIVQ